MDEEEEDCTGGGSPREIPGYGFMWGKQVFY